MVDSVVGFRPGDRVKRGVHAVGRTTLHRHPDALEIVLVLRGSLQVKVSCEDFDLAPGDYAVLNRGDAHMLTGSPDNVTGLVHLDLDAFRDIDADAGDLIFACESFDLPRYRRQEVAIRTLLLDILDTDEDPLEPAASLITILCDGYSLEDYYNRGSGLTAGQREKFHRIVGSLRRQRSDRDALAAVAAEHHYSKSHVSHTFKEISGISFGDLLGYLRVADAENALLSSDATMVEIAADCGFSDPKYFTRTFVNWFGESPAEYRRRHRPMTRRDDDIAVVEPATVSALVAEHRHRPRSGAPETPRLSVTPLLLKNVGSRLDLTRTLRTGPAQSPPGVPVDRNEAVPHLLPVKVTPADIEQGYLIEGLDSFASDGVSPCLVIEFTTVAACLDMIAEIAERLSHHGRSADIWLTYAAAHQRAGVDDVVRRSRREFGVHVQPVMTP